MHARKHLGAAAVFFAWVVCFAAPAWAQQTAFLDPVSAHMAAEPADVAPNRQGPLPHHVDAPVPRRMVLAAWCTQTDTLRAWRAAWHLYAEQMGYVLVAPTAPSDDADGLWPHQLMRCGRCALAERVVGWSLLAQGGGVLVTPAVWPPSLEGAWVDFAALFSLRGLVATAAERPHNMEEGASGLTLDDALVLAPAAHPVVQHLVATLPKNVAALTAYDPHVALSYLAGHALFTRVVNGPLTVLPHDFLSLFCQRIF